MQKRAQATKQKILLAGIEEFSQHGYHGAKIDAIATQAAVNKQRIYAYFTNKDGLFEAVLQNCFERLLQYEDILLRIDENQAEELAERILRHYMAFHEQTPQFWRLLAWCNLEGVEVQAQVSRIDGAVFQHLRKLYALAQKQGHYAVDVSFEVFIYSLTALSFFYYANMKTMSRSLQLDLHKDEVRDRLIIEMLKQFSGKA